MRTARQILERQFRQRKLQAEIGRLEDRKENILKKKVFERTFDEQKFLDGIEATLHKLIRELHE